MDTTQRVEEDLKRLQGTKGVKAYIVINSEGQTIRSRGLDDTATVSQYATQVKQLTMNAMNMVRTLDPQNDLTFLRLRSKKHEIMVHPGNGYDIIVLQNFKDGN